MRTSVVQRGTTAAVFRSSNHRHKDHKGVCSRRVICFIQLKPTESSVYTRKNMSSSGLNIQRGHNHFHRLARINESTLQ